MRTRTIFRLLFVIAVGFCLPGCATGTNERWHAFKTDFVDTVKAFSGTGEYLGSSTEAREVERSLARHRQ